jgi:hypothetical protein
MNYNANREDAAWNKNFQQQQSDISNRQWEQNFNAQQDQNAWQRGFSEKQFNAQQDQNTWQKQFSEQQFAAQQKQNDIANQQWEQTFNANQSQQALENAFREKQFNSKQEQQAIANQQWERQFNANQLQQTIANQQWEQQFNANQQQQTIQNQQWEQGFNAQQAQWREQFDYNALSDVQQSAFKVVAQAAALGNDVDDYLLGRAGLTRADFNSMKQQANFNGGAGAGKPAPWEAAGFDSETTYKAAQAIGANTPTEYLIALATRPRTQGATPYNPDLPEMAEKYKKDWNTLAEDALKNRKFG